MEIERRWLWLGAEEWEERLVMTEVEGDDERGVDISEPAVL
jgi:hypothetical protein